MNVNKPAIENMCNIGETAGEAPDVKHRLVTQASCAGPARREKTGHQGCRSGITQIGMRRFRDYISIIETRYNICTNQKSDAQASLSFCFSHRQNKLSTFSHDGATARRDHSHSLKDSRRIVGTTVP